MINALKFRWFDLSSKYVEDNSIVTSLWEDILNRYSEKHRYYHNLFHIQNMLFQAEDFKSHITAYDELLFSIWYHDIIYKSTRKDNEVQSAALAQKRLQALNLDEEQIQTIQNLILSTKKHHIILSETSDNAYLLDMDLSILGTDWDIYKTYTNQIRKEYKIYPDFMYKPGRKKVLHYFLERDFLYFTEAYRTTHEAKARTNIKKELELL